MDTNTWAGRIFAATRAFSTRRPATPDWWIVTSKRSGRNEAGTSMNRPGPRWSAFGLAWLMAISTGLAQDTPAPSPAGAPAPILVPAPEPARVPAQDEVRLPALPRPTTPPVVAVPTSREAQLEARVQQLEAMVQQLYQQQAAANAASVGTGREFGPGMGGPPTGSASNLDQPGTTGLGPAGTGGLTGGSRGGPGVPGQGFPPVPDVQPRFDVPAPLEDRSAHVRFGPGFEIATDDDEFIMQFHDLTQFDYRQELNAGANKYFNTFLIPRQWFIFSGHLTKEIGYFVSASEGVDTLNGLDIFVDFNYDKRLQFRAGRFKTPFTYEFFAEPVQGMILPEYSLFLNNFGQQRDEGIMAYGQLFDTPSGTSRIQYATGIFNGNPNGFSSNQNGKFTSSFLNFHPFGDREGSLLENLNFGGSVYAGVNNQPANPSVFRTIVATPAVATVGLPFLALNPHTMLSGPEALWDMHLAYFYQQFALIGEWRSGYQNYAINTNPQTRSERTNVPINSFYVQASYLLTGETRSQIGIVKPLEPFSLRPGEFGLGAWEIFGRYDYLLIGDQIFTNGLANTSGNANRVWTTDIGINWHMTQYVKMLFAWKHDEFNMPVTYATTPTKMSNTANTLWWRVQVFF